MQPSTKRSTRAMPSSLLGMATARQSKLLCRWWSTMARGICADCDEHLFILRIICGTSANDAHFCMMLAGVPQASYSFEIYLREFRKKYAILRNICGISASIIQFCNIFAEAPQAICNFATCLRKFRKRNVVFEYICGSSASNMQFLNIFAELPQMWCKVKRD